MPVTRNTLAQLQALRVEVGTLADDGVRQVAEAWLAVWDTLAPRWQAAVAAAVDQAARTGSWPSSWQLARIPEVATAVAATEQSSDSLGKTVLEVAVAAAVGAVAVTAVAEPLILASQLPKALAATAAAGFAGKLLPGRLGTIRDSTRRRVTNLIHPLASLALNSTKRALVRGVPGNSASGLLGGIRAAFTAGVTRAAVVIGTETLDANRLTSAYANEALADTAGTWIWQSACDRRTCPGCWAMHGTVHSLAEEGPSGHQNCRCVRLVLAKPWQQLGITGDEPPSVLVDGETRFRKLSHADQLQIMGPTRLELLDSGDVDFASLAIVRSTRGWRNAYIPATVTDLRRVAGRR